MLRATTSQSIRRFSTNLRRMIPDDGSVGGTRSGGEASGDAFNKREKAQEDYAIKQREKEKLVALRKQLEEQKSNLSEMEKKLAEEEAKHN